MTRKIHVKPRAGLSVPDPAVRGGTSAQAMIPPAGKLVADSTYWRRRVRHGDVTISEASTAPSAPSPSTKKSAGTAKKDGDA